MTKKNSEKNLSTDQISTKQSNQINNSKLAGQLKMRRSAKFYIAYIFAILAWYSYSTFMGVDMTSWTKSNHWQAKGSQHQSGKLYSHK